MLSDHDPVRDDPVRDDELAGLFYHLRHYSTLIIAVSGGADSTALLHLLARWGRFPALCPPASLTPVQIWPTMVVATVDHGLRPDSATEALAVAAHAQTLGLAHRTLPWEHGREKPASAIQATAREARYRLLEALALAHPRPALLTAHHQDDQAETVLMRLARGSGLDGLAGIRGSWPARGLQLVARERPLLGVPKARLVATLRAAGLTWSEDPSNANRAFERVRWRDAERHLADLGLTAEAIARSARRLDRARLALEATTDAAWNKFADSHAGAFVTLAAPAFGSQPEEIRLRLLLRALIAWGGQQQPPSLAQTEDLLAAISSEPFAGQTLAGCRIERDAAEIRIFREPGRQGLPVLDITPGQVLIWDNRFRVALHADVGSDVSAAALDRAIVRSLGTDGLAALRLQGDIITLPARVAWTLPSLWTGPEGALTLAAVPHLGRHIAGLSVQFLW